jgi:hypothetical protein
MGCEMHSFLGEKEESLAERAAALLDEEEKLYKRAELLEEREGNVPL